MFIGIDVSASRGYDLCTLDDKRRVSLLVKARDLATLEPILRQFPKNATFAVDAPSTPARGLIPGKDYRVAEHDLRRLGISLYYTPGSEEAAPAWMREALRGRVGGLPGGAEQDVLDAACAALTAWHFVNGSWVAYGDPSEGV